MVFHYEDKVLFNAAHKRINKADENKNTVEEYIYTDWISFLRFSDREEKFIESMNIKGLSFNNVYRVYCDVIDRINIFNASKYQSDFEALNIKGVVKVKAIVNEIEKLDVEILKLKSKIKYEAQFNKKVEMNIEIKKNETRRKQLIQVLNN